jgi:lipopolysaccharide/colanic/teichoic acid biosynthesis glycosyltransferase
MNSLQRIRASHARVRHTTPRGSASRARTGHRGATAKRCLDLVLGLVLVILLLPVMAVVAIAVRVDGAGPILFRQRRLGRDMKPFTVLKFRTMAVDSSPELHQRYIADLVSSEANGGLSANGDVAASRNGNGDVKKLTADPRVTRVGRLLRRVSLDELPQLFNVVAGSMSLVGPRPALEYELEHYEPGHYERFSVRPGVTGLWQVSGRNRLGFREMLELDAQYARDLSLVRDIGILARTPLAAIRHTA